MTNPPQNDDAVSQKRPTGLLDKIRDGGTWLKANRKRFFWWWVLYQAVKGLVTLTLIWIPLIMIWFGLRGSE